MENCIFCKIVSDEISSKKVYEDELVMAFYDTNPLAKVHVLVIPKKHISSVKELEEGDKELLFHIYKVINKVAKQLDIDESGFRVMTNTGKDAGQTVQHLHFHILGGEPLPEK